LILFGSDTGYLVTPSLFIRIIANHPLTMM
jgi:hypothetical protein